MQINNKLKSFIRTSMANSGNDFFEPTTTDDLLEVIQIEQLGNNFSIENGKVKCLKNGYIQASAKVHIQAINSTGVKWFELYKNNNAIAQIPTYMSNRGTLVIPAITFSVNAGDLISIHIGAKGDKIRKNLQYTSLDIQYL